MVHGYVSDEYTKDVGCHVTFYIFIHSWRDGHIFSFKFIILVKCSILIAGERDIIFVQTMQVILRSGYEG